MNSPEHHPFRSATARDQFLERYDRRAARWPVASEPVMIATSFGRTFVRVSGPAGAPPLVLLHGIGGSSLQWAANVEALSGGHRVFAIDHISDNGRSVYTRVPRNIDEMTTWLDELFDGLGLGDDIELVGVSYGGWLASQYARRFPRRLRKLVLLAPVFTVLPLSFTWILRAVLCVIPLRWFTRSFMFWLLEDLASAGEDGRRTVEEWAEDSFVAMRSFTARRVVNPTILSDEELRSLKVPTLFLVGENEKIYSAERALARLRRVAPGIETEMIPGAGHDLTIVAAKRVNEKLCAFLDAPVVRSQPPSPTPGHH
jgi:pimeloyl-ACP methyl ester carboxylesterase